MRVYKYPINPISVTKLELPKDAEILSVKTINDNAFIWVLIDETKPTISRYFSPIPTGSNIRFKIIKFIGTFLIDKGILVFHLFEIEKEENM